VIDWNTLKSKNFVWHQYIELALDRQELGEKLLETWEGGWLTDRGMRWLGHPTLVKLIHEGYYREVKLSFSARFEESFQTRALVIREDEDTLLVLKPEKHVYESGQLWQHNYTWRNRPLAHRSVKKGGRESGHKVEKMTDVVPETLTRTLNEELEKIKKDTWHVQMEPLYTGKESLLDVTLDTGENIKVGDILCDDKGRPLGIALGGVDPAKEGGDLSVYQSFPFPEGAASAKGLLEHGRKVMEIMRKRHSS
jgi:hypothetical protein